MSKGLRVHVEVMAVSGPVFSLSGRVDSVNLHRYVDSNKSEAMWLRSVLLVIEAGGCKGEDVSLHIQIEGSLCNPSCEVYRGVFDH